CLSGSQRLGGRIMAEPLKATWFAFRKRERGGVLLGATTAYIVISLAILAAFVAVNWSAFGPVGDWYVRFVSTALQHTGERPPTPPPELLSILPGYLLVLFVTFILLAAYEAACLRWMVRGETGGLFGLTFGADTWRVYAGYWVWFGVFLVLY